jgi:hypothetical protein
MNDDPQCPNCDAYLLPSGECPFEDCDSALPDWVLMLDEEYHQTPEDLDDLPC